MTKIKMYDHNNFPMIHAKTIFNDNLNINKAYVTYNKYSNMDRLKLSFRGYKKLIIACNPPALIQWIIERPKLQIIVIDDILTHIKRMYKNTYMYKILTVFKQLELLNREIYVFGLPSKYILSKYNISLPNHGGVYASKI